MPDLRLCNRVGISLQLDFAMTNDAQVTQAERLELRKAISDNITLFSHHRAAILRLIDSTLPRDAAPAGHAVADWPPPFEMMKLQARRDGHDWVDIFPAQLSAMVKNGCEVRALEAVASPRPLLPETRGALRTFDTTKTVFRRAGNILTITCEDGETANRVSDELRTERATIPADTQAMREALRPFVAVAMNDIGSDESDDDIFKPILSGHNHVPLLTVGDFRRAEAALAATGHRAGGEADGKDRPFYGAECPTYPNCNGGCGLGCTKGIDLARSIAAAGQADGVREAAEKVLSVLKGPHYQGGASLVAIGEAYGILDDALSGPASHGEGRELPEIPDDDADFTPDLARKIIAKYQQLLRARPPSLPREVREALDHQRLDWLQDRIVDTIYLDDGKIIDVRGDDLRQAIDEAKTRWPESLEDEDGDSKHDAALASLPAGTCGETERLNGMILTGPPKSAAELVELLERRLGSMKLIGDRDDLLLDCAVFIASTLPAKETK